MSEVHITDEMVDAAYNFAWDRLAPNSHHKRMEIPSDAEGFIRELLRAALAVQRKGEG